LIVKILRGSRWVRIGRAVKDVLAPERKKRVGRRRNKKKDNRKWKRKWKKRRVLTYNQ
jgi:hypothetical protein